MSDLIGAGSGPADLIKDTTIETFEADVLQESMTTPVIVDFWATWCGPCKQLTPVLEKAVLDAKGAVKLVKVDIDKNQMLASQLRIQSVPTIYGFFQGRPVDGFQGALPESEIKAFIGRMTQLAGGADTGAPDLGEMLAMAEQALVGGDIASAAQLFAQIAQAAEEDEETKVKALAGLARCHLATGETEQARSVLDMVPEAKKSDPAVSGVLATLSLADEGTDPSQAPSLQERVNANPADLQARFDLAGALIGGGNMEAALEQLLSIIEQDRTWNEEAARKKVLTIFEALGPMHPISVRGRRKLSAMLFS